ncbi:hypothetical protein [Paenibacillus sp. J22TS3]|uniref:hypothetical protein n=1 Tax=Paenibacillus sp. J22TS3 TaxID=2807192 RepID=UPI001B1FE043|nr:hypothetical protein [Paenibacillus sp. J22TS3]GIP24328.1 hypothetical protein J22TS3_46030 [Paenibacillus sp. J22TS3]
MLFIILVTGAIVNAALCAASGAILLMGIVFFLIGLPEFKQTGRSRTWDIIRQSLPILFTLLAIITYMIITYWCAHTGGTLAFSRSAPANVQLGQAKKLLTLGFLHGVYSLITFKWVLPGIIGKLGLDRRHIWGIAAGAILTAAGGAAAWLMLVP